MSRQDSASRRAAADAEDWALIRAIGGGDQQALAALYRRHFDYLYRFVLRVTRRTEVVEEVINEVMLVVWQQASKAEPRALASTWILSIAHRKALKTLSRKGLAEDGLDDDDPRFGVDAAGLQGVDADDLLLKALAVLTPEQRAVMEMVYEQGLHYSVIAEILGCPENTVKTRVFHARRKLRAAWPALTGAQAPAATMEGSELP
jgi:RNA polymerase sigma factor (sigma-70 family)